MDLNVADVGTGVSMTGIALVFAVFGFLRGVVRIVFSMLALGVGIVAGYWGYLNGPSIAEKIVDSPEPWMSYGVAGVIGIGAHSICKTILNFLTGSVNQSSAVRKVGFGAPAGLFGLLVGGVIASGALSGAKYLGSLAELEYLDHYVYQRGQQDIKVPMALKIKQFIEQSQFGKWHQKVDLVNNEAQLNLAKLFVIRQSPYYAARASASETGRRVLGQPDITRALITGGDLALLVEDKRFFDLLNEEKLKKVLQKAEIKEILSLVDIEKSIGAK